MALLSFAASADGASDDVELRIKAAYLLNFARFVEWPGSPASSSAPVVIGVLGQDPIVATLEATVRGKNIKGHPIRIMQFLPDEQFDRCDILFIPRSQTKKSRALLLQLIGKPVLSVGEASGFLGQGGIIEFQLIDDTLRFSIDLTSAGRNGVQISSELLKVAYSVTGKRK